MLVNGAEPFSLPIEQYRMPALSNFKSIPKVRFAVAVIPAAGTKLEPLFVEINIPLFVASAIIAELLG